MQPIIVNPGESQLAVYRYHIENPPLRGKKKGSKLAHRRTQVGMQLTNLRLAAMCPNAQALLDSYTGGKGPRRSWTEWTPKLFACLEIIRERLAHGQQVIVGAPFREFSTTLMGKLAEAEVRAVLLDGDTSPQERGLLAADFKTGKYPVLVAGLKAMGEGHSFENCSHLVLPGLSYAYDENEQFIHRIWRLTSPGPVTIYPIIMRGSIDEKLHEIFTEKADAASLAIDGRLFVEPDRDVDMEWILNETIAAFDPNVATVDELTLIVEWESAARRLRHAHLQYYEHQAHSDPSPEEAQAAVSALNIPSPTQLTVNYCRKHFLDGTYRSEPVTGEHIRKMTAMLREKNRRGKKS